MKNSKILTLTLSLLIVTAGFEALAQQGQHQGGMGKGMPMMQGSCPMHGMQMRKHRSKSYSKGRIAFLKAELEITEAQETIFEAYAKSMADNLKQMQSMRSNMHTMMQAETPVKRLNIHINMMESRLDSLKAMQGPTKALFEVLSEKQRKKASELLPSMACMQ